MKKITSKQIKNLENYIKNHDGSFKIDDLCVIFKDQIDRNLYYFILGYLFGSNKISIDAENKVGWIYYPESVKKRANTLNETKYSK